MARRRREAEQDRARQQRAEHQGPRPPARRAEQIGARGGEDQRGDVELVAVLDELAELPAVERRGDEHDGRHGEEHQGGDGVGAALARRGQCVDGPRHGGQEGHDPDADDDHHQVRAHGRQRPRRDRVAREEHVVVAGRPADAARRRQRGDREHRDRAARRDRCMLAQHRADAGEAAQPPQLVDHDRGREGEPQHDELGAREDRDGDGAEGDHVGSPRRPRRRAHAREHRPDEDRVGERLGHEEVRVDGPRGRDRQHGGQVRAGPPRSSLARQQEGGNRRAGHQHRVHGVRHRERGGRRQQPVERREDERVGRRVLREALAVYDREGRQRVADVQRELDVEQLVGHHAPAGHAQSPEGEPGRSDDDDRGQPERIAPALAGSVRPRRHRRRRLAVLWLRNGRAHARGARRVAVQPPCPSRRC